MTNTTEDLKTEASLAAPLSLNQRPERRRSTSKEQKSRRTNIACYTVLIVLVAALMIPFAWMLSSSVKQDNQVFTVPIQWIPEDFVWSNYADIWTRIPMMGYIQNTMYLAVFITFLQVLTGSLAAYGFAKVRFPGRDASAISPPSPCRGRPTWCRSTS